MPSYLYPCTIFGYVTLSPAAAEWQPLIYLLFPPLADLGAELFTFGGV